MRIIIFGANGQTGRLLTSQALGQGHEVSAVTRRPNTYPLHHERLTIVGGDARDADAVVSAVSGQDAVLSCLGVPFTRRPVDLYSRSICNLLAAMDRHGVRRLVCVSSSAVVPGLEAGGGLFFEKVVVPLVSNTIGKTTYVDLRRMEQLVTESGLEWTIVRPSGLFMTAAVTDYEVAVGRAPGRFTSRRDVADFMLRVLAEGSHLGEAPCIASLSAQPGLLRLIWREGLSRRAA